MSGIDKFFKGWFFFVILIWSVFIGLLIWGVLYFAPKVGAILEKYAQ